MKLTFTENKMADTFQTTAQKWNYDKKRTISEEIFINRVYFHPLCSSHPKRINSPGLPRSNMRASQIYGTWEGRISYSYKPRHRILQPTSKGEEHVTPCRPKLWPSILGKGYHTSILQNDLILPKDREPFNTDTTLASG